ncbi:MAG: GGDEF domain-containing protein [Actinomycetota bacterium]
MTAPATSERDLLDLDTVVNQFGDLGTLAPVAMKVIQLVEDPDSSMADLANAIKVDPALTARLLRLANSAQYAQRSEVTNIERAAALLGLHTIKLISLGFTLVSGMTGGGVDTARIWRRSIAGSVLAQRIAANIDRRMTDDAFVGGLLSNVGKLSLADDPVYIAAVADNGLFMSPEAERAAIGFATDELTARVLVKWELPPTLSDAISGRGGDGDPTDLSDVLAVADAAAVLLVIDGADGAAAAYDHLRMAAAARLGMSIEEVEAVLTEVKPDLDDLTEMFDLDVVTTSPGDIMMSAATQLTRLSLDVASALAQEQQRNTELTEENQQLTEQASTDPLTGLPNRRTFDAYLSNQIAGRRRNDRTGALGMIIVDLDHFKSINDNFGHAVGDEVLQEVGERIKNGTRRAELSARVGGEEFALVLPQTSDEELTMVAERFRGLIGEEPIETAMGPLTVTASLGAAMTADVGDDDITRKLYESADRALYTSKSEGRDRVTVADKVI